MTKFLPLLLAALLATPVQAFDVLNPDDAWGARKEKPAKAPREKNDGKYLEYLGKTIGTGLGLGVNRPVFRGGPLV